MIKGVTLTNGGTIDNNVVLNTGGTVINDGLVESTGEGNLVIRDTTIDSSGGGVVTDAKRIQLSNGTISGGTLTIDAGAVLINDTLTVELAADTVVNFGSIESGLGALTLRGERDRQVAAMGQGDAGGHHAARQRLHRQDLWLLQDRAQHRC